MPTLLNDRMESAIFSADFSAKMDEETTHDLTGIRRRIRPSLASESLLLRPNGRWLGLMKKAKLKSKAIRKSSSCDGYRWYICIRSNCIVLRMGKNSMAKLFMMKD